MSKSKEIRIRVAGILLNDKNEILLINHVKNGKSYWLFPGGGVEYGETMEEALKREFEEELSLKIKKVHNMVFLNDSIYPDKKRHIINIYFRVEPYKTSKIKVNPDKIIHGAEFINMEKFRKILFYPAIKSDILFMWRKKFGGAFGRINAKWKD